MSIATRSFFPTTPILGLVCLISGAPIAAAQAEVPPVDATRSPSASDWVRRSEKPAIDVTNPTAVKQMPVKSVSGVLTQQVVEADVNKTSPGLDYAALVVDFDGADNIFVKVQDNDGDGDFDTIYFYHGNSGGAWAGMTGGAFNVTLAPAENFTSGHMKLTHDGIGNVTLELTNLNGSVPSITHTRGGWIPLSGVGYGMGFYSGIATLDNWDVFYSSGGTVCDTFDRADGPMGDDWVTQGGNAFIMGNTAAGTSTAMVTYVGDCGGGIQTVEADVMVIGTATTYCALVLNSDGQDNLYIKLQQQEGTGQFDRVGFYHAVNINGWPGQIGGLAFFTIDAADRFSSAHMKVILYPDGIVRLLITNRNTGGGLLEYQRGGWTVRSGNDSGIGLWYTTGFLDNFAVNGVSICDDFNRADGALGPNWITDTGTNVIAGGQARANGSVVSRSIFVGTCQAVCPSDINGDGSVNVTDLLALLATWGTCP